MICIQLNEKDCQDDENKNDAGGISIIVLCYDFSSTASSKNPIDSLMKIESVSSRHIRVTEVT